MGEWQRVWSREDYQDRSECRDILRKSPFLTQTYLPNSRMKPQHFSVPSSQSHFFILSWTLVAGLCCWNCFFNCCDSVHLGEEDTSFFKSSNTNVSALLYGDNGKQPATVGHEFCLLYIIVCFDGIKLINYMYSNPLCLKNKVAKKQDLCTFNAIYGQRILSIGGE